jgi:hypothetical protein
VLFVEDMCTQFKKMNFSSSSCNDILTGATGKRKDRLPLDGIILPDIPIGFVNYVSWIHQVYCRFNRD